jgi:thymidine phosphorylase
MVAALGGPRDLLERPDEYLPAAPVTIEAQAERPGVVAGIDVRAVGLAVIDLGGGRRREDDAIDHAVGLTEVAAPGERVGPHGRPLAIVHARDEDAAAHAAQALAAAFRVGDRVLDENPAVLEIVS